jgi:hypothetical protein
MAMMKTATTREQNRQWVQQWRETGIFPEEIKRDELGNKTAEEGWRAADRLLSLVPHYRRLSRTSGLVKQQASFRKRTRK